MNRVYIKEIIYKSGLTTSDLIREMMSNGVEKNKVIYCDSARPDIIEELKRAGYNARSSDKNVKQGIDTVKQMEIFVHYESLNILKEYKLYNWKTDKDRVLDEPVKINDDAMDALRYAIHTHKGKSVDITRMRFY